MGYDSVSFGPTIEIVRWIVRNRAVRSRSDHRNPGISPPRRAVRWLPEGRIEPVSGGCFEKRGTLTVSVKHFVVYAVRTAELPGHPTTQTVLTDIAGNWAAANIENLVRAPSSGYPDGTFRPGAKITRAEFVTALVKALRLTPETGPVFADTQGTWAQVYITTAADGLVSEYESSHVGPDDPITRELVRLTLVRWSNTLGIRS